MAGVRRGVLISFEGVEGSGKTTQAQALVEWLSRHKISHIFVREPGSTAVGEAIREILLNSKYRMMHSKCEVLLFLAARSQLTYEKILPSLQQKKVIITDRFADSTFAYQVYARNLPQRLLTVFNRFATAGIKPDLTFLVDIDISKGRERGVFDDRMETEDMLYHQRVRDAYLRIARRAQKRIKTLDGAAPIDVLRNEVIGFVKDLLTRKGYTV